MLETIYSEGHRLAHILMHIAQFFVHSYSSDLSLHFYYMFPIPPIIIYLFLIKFEYGTLLFENSGNFVLLNWSTKARSIQAGFMTHALNLKSVKFKI